MSHHHSVTNIPNAAASRLTVTARFMAILALTSPWLNPFAFGPSPSVVPWLVAFASTAGLVALALLHSSHNPTAPCKTFPLRWAVSAATAWLLAGLLSTGIALLQYFGVSDAFEPLVNHARVGEAFANLRQRNQFATLTVMALAALIWLTTSKGITRRAPLRAGWATVAMGCALAVGNAASQSRTGIVQLGLMCALGAVWRLRGCSKYGSIMLAAVVTYTVAAFLLPILAGFELSAFGMAARLLDGDQPCASRLTLWSNVLTLIAQKPWLGWGWGELDYAHYITLYDGPRFCDILDNAHNLPLHLAVELGIPLAVVVCGGFAWWVFRQRPWRETDPTRQLAWSVLAIILLHSMLEYPLWYGPFQMAFGLCLALLWQTRPHAFKAPASQLAATKHPVARYLAASVAIFLIAGTAYAAWDYHRISQIYLTPQARDAAYRTDTLSKIQGSFFFGDQVRFAELLLTPLTRENAQWTFDTASALLHFSPEPRVIEKVIESAVMLGRDADALRHLARFRAAFPVDYARWAAANRKALSRLPLSVPGQ